MAKSRFILLAVAGLALAAHSVVGQGPPPFPKGNDAIDGFPQNLLEIPAVPGAPFSATAVVELQDYEAEDGGAPQRTINLIARDSKGRTHNELRALMPESFHGTPHLLLVRIEDPQTHTRIDYLPLKHLALRMTMPSPPQPPPGSDATVQAEDLGASTMNGVQVQGVHRTFTLPKHGFGWGKPRQWETEDWTSQELHLTLLTKFMDERVGEWTVGLSNLKREEPPASMFAVPEGYRMQEWKAGDRPRAPEGKTEKP